MADRSESPIVTSHHVCRQPLSRAYPPQNDFDNVANRRFGSAVHDPGYGRVGLGISCRGRYGKLGMDLCEKRDRRGTCLGMGHGRARDGVSRRGGGLLWSMTSGGLLGQSHLFRFLQMCLISWQSAKLVNETIHLAIQDYVLRDWVTALFSMVSELSRLSI